MANRVYTGRRDVKVVNCVVSIGATGAPTLDTTKSWGVASVARSAAGKYTVTFGLLKDGVAVVDTYRDLLGVIITPIGLNGTAAPVNNITEIVNDLTASSGTIEVWFETVARAFTELVSGTSWKAVFIFADGSGP
jgi:hypothetical protein